MALSIFLTALHLTISTSAQAQSTAKAFPLKNVRLLNGVFKNAQDVDLRYMLSLDPDRLLTPYLREAGLDTIKPSYGNWENTGLDGHIGGHYLSALSEMAASTGDKMVNERLDYMLIQLKRCQDKIATGYVGGMPGGIELWKEIEQGKIKTEDFSLNGKWVPLYNLHKLLAGLRDAYTIAGKPLAKNILIRLTDFILNVSNKLSDDQIQTMLVSEHGALNEVFADVALITGNKNYLLLARRFSHKKLLEPLEKGDDNLNGLHANMQIPKAVGFKRIADIGGDTNYSKAAQFFWETVVQHRTVVIGGNSTSEHFHPSDDFSSMITDVAGPETCNTYNMLKLTKAFFLSSQETRYINYYERALYNHILSSQHPVRGGFVYYTPMRPRHYRVYSRPQECMWCCVGSGMENHGKYGELIYSYSADKLFVNLFISSRLYWREKGIIISQQTKFPDEQITQLNIEASNGNEFDIKIRYPEWVEATKMQITVNGQRININAAPGSYVPIRRFWKKGDKITVRLPMKISIEQMPDGSNYLAFLHGPIVLAAKTDTTEKDDFLGTANQFGGYRANGKLYPVDSISLDLSNKTNPEQYILTVQGKSQTFVAPSLIEPAIYKNLELIPFYKLHDARYIIYWPYKKKDGYKNE